MLIMKIREKPSLPLHPIAIVEKGRETPPLYKGRLGGVLRQFKVNTTLAP
jgi:hypothetical protein